MPSELLRSPAPEVYDPTTVCATSSRHERTGEPEGLPAHLKFATSRPDARAHQVAQAAPLHHPPLKPPVEQHEAHDWRLQYMVVAAS